MLKIINDFKIIVIIIFFLISILLFYCLFFLKKVINITGKTMGTTYDIKVVSKLLDSKNNLNSIINYRLAEINTSFSTYDMTSEISCFNSLESLEEKFYPSRDFLSLLFVSEQLYEISGNVWDPTINTVVNAWGFGRADPKNHILNHTELEFLLDNIGFKKAVNFCNDGSIKKGFINATIDFASIAKGFGVDQISLLLHKKGFDNFLIEIGGEIYAKGSRIDGRSWKIGINYPEKKISFNKIYKIISLTNKAVATSGDYRNFIQIEDQIYSHIIDPRTGYPISNCVTSVSVFAENCTIADGLATALMVMNPQEAVLFINNLPSTECIITFLEKNENLRSYNSKGIEKL
jgi:thiamine biosynthesis lipoprotein